MTDERLDQLLDQAMALDESPDLWRRIEPCLDRSVSWREVRWALGVGAAVLLAWTMTPGRAMECGDWQPVALKSKLRAESLAAGIPIPD